MILHVFSFNINMYYMSEGDGIIQDIGALVSIECILKERRM